MYIEQSFGEKAHTMKNITRLWFGELTSAELPQTIVLGKVGQVLDKMYRDSSQDLCERASVLFLNQAGRLCASQVFVGDERQVVIHRPELGAGE